MRNLSAAPCVVTLPSGRRVACAVRPSRRARRGAVRFLYGADGRPRVEVVLPLRRRADTPESLLAMAGRWLDRQFARDARRSVAAPPPGPGEMFLAGRRIRVVGRPADLFAPRAPVWEGDRPLVPGDTPGDRAEALRREIERRARAGIDASLGRRLEEMSETISGYALRNQDSLWGSCSRARRRLSFNVRLAMAPPEALDYVVVHEIAHLAYQSHGPRFWARVERFCPSAKSHRRWLRDHGPLLRIPTAIADRTIESTD